MNILYESQFQIINEIVAKNKNVGTNVFLSFITAINSIKLAIVLMAKMTVKESFGPNLLTKKPVAIAAITSESEVTIIFSKILPGKYFTAKLIR